MKKTVYLLLVAMMTLMIATSCGSSKGVAYLQDDDSDGMFEQAFANQTKIMYDARIMPKDLLTITVHATEEEAVRPFNLMTPTRSTAGGGGASSKMEPYLVDNEGFVNFPVLGKIMLKGLTKGQAEEKIKGMLMQYVKEEPIVTVKSDNYKISVIGEVGSPSSFTVVNEKVNIFEALAMAGDMTIYGRRDNVKIIREDAQGLKRIVHMNLNDRNIIYSDNFYLQQNDVVYVEPNKVKAQNSGIGASTSLWLSGIGIVFSAASLVFTILK